MPARAAAPNDLCILLRDICLTFFCALVPAVSFLSLLFHSFPADGLSWLVFTGAYKTTLQMRHSDEPMSVAFDNCCSAPSCVSRLLLARKTVSGSAASPRGSELPMPTAAARTGATFQRPCPLATLARRACWRRRSGVETVERLHGAVGVGGDTDRRRIFGSFWSHQVGACLATSRWLASFCVERRWS